MQNIKIILYIIGVALISGCMEYSPITPEELLCEAKKDPVGISTTLPRFNWKNIASTNKVKQTAYQILVASSPELLNETKADLWNSGKVMTSNSIWIPYQGVRLQSRSVACWKVRIWDQDDKSSSWSNTAHFSVGLLEKDDWKGAYIGLISDDDACTSPLLRKAIKIEKEYEQLFMHVNSLGYHELYVNNRKVGNAVLAPAESQFDKRSFSLSYDLSPYLEKGENAIVLWLGYGWYDKARNKVHNGPLVRAQLDGLKDGIWHNLLSTNEEWLASGSGYTFLRPPGYGFGGEVMDAGQLIPGFSDPELDDSTWKKAAGFEVPDHMVTPQVVEANRVHEIITPVSITRMEDDRWLVDMGKNFTGGTHISFPVLPKGHEVTLRYSDNLIDGDNELLSMQIDKFISADDTADFQSLFNYHAYRYLIIENLPVEINKEAITGQFIYTDFGEGSTFLCSDETLNQVHDLFAYTLKCLTLGGKIVDCPHHERLGYGGDGNACTPTAQTLFNLSSLYTTWLTHWSDCMEPDGSLPHTAPTFWRSGGGPYWCAFLVKASWESYVNYGDSGVLRTFYPIMLKWFEYVQKYSPNILLEQWPETRQRGWYLGDWAVPDGVDQQDPRSVGLVSNCAILDSYDKMVKIATVLNKKEDAKLFTERKSELSAAVHSKFYNPDNATYATGSQIDLSYPLILNIVPDSLIGKVTQSLMSETLQNRKGHFATGLVGLPVLTQWAVSNEASGLMYLMMTQKDYPGFGYMIANGATTTWEHWNGERSRIHNCYHGVGTWFYQSIGGLQPLERYPGYQRFVIAPRPPEAVSWANVKKETPYGTIILKWEKNQGNMNIQVSVPVGSMANLILPKGISTCLIDAEKATIDSDGSVWIENGVHDIIYVL
jgi:alpha-L-rhamnosidase